MLGIWAPNEDYVSFVYDHAGRRIRKTVNGATVNYLYNGPDILAEYSSWGKADASYVHGPATDDPLLRQTAANDVSYHHADGLGSIVAHTDATSRLTAAQLYDAWGQPHATASLGSLGRYGYTGREPDETGLMYYRARYYDPAIGRFTQRDPLGMPDGVNRYAYVAGDPVNFTDPTGEFIPQLIGATTNVILGWTLSNVTNSNYDIRHLTADFIVGFGSSGVAGVQKGTALAKALISTNTAPAKFITAAAGEAYKGVIDNKSREAIGVTSVVAGALNGSGVIGKAANAVATRTGLVSAGHQLDNSVAALLQPKVGSGATNTTAAALMTESIGMPANYLATWGNDTLGNWLDGNKKPAGSQTLPTLSQPDPTAGGLFSSPDSFCYTCQQNYGSGGASNQGGKLKF